MPSSKRSGSDNVSIQSENHDVLGKKLKEKDKSLCMIELGIGFVYLIKALVVLDKR